MRPAIATYATRPDLLDALNDLSDPWPEFIHHANCNRLWHVMRERFPQFQIILYDEETDRPLGRGQTIPVRWDGSVEGLPGGVDDAIEYGAALAEGEANTLSAIVAVLDRSAQGRGLSSLLIDGMRAAAAAGGLQALIAPVRPTLKERYPLIPMERYIAWRRDDGSAFDPRDPCARAARSGDRRCRGALDDRGGHRRRLGGMDADAVSGDRRVRPTAGARAD
jgi:hypothetical protein